MKKTLTLITTSLLILISTSCKSTKVSCDTYNQSKQEEELELEFDIYKVSQEKQSKFITFTKIK